MNINYIRCLERLNCFVIRRINENDIDEVIEIWERENINAHPFIPSKYWLDNVELVKKQMLTKDVFVYENTNKIEAFIGIDDNYIEGIFVSSALQCQGIGKSLLNYIKKDKDYLFLYVYQKNKKAINFYLKEGFIIKEESIDKATNEKDYLMEWHKC